MQKWKKLGQVFEPKNNSDWMVTHATVPFVGKIYGDSIKVFFSVRNSNQESSIGFVVFDINSLEIKGMSETPILSKGELGCFDDSGVMGCCVIDAGNVERMYYIGWNLGVTVPFRNSIGIAESKDGGKTFKKPFAGPIIERTKDEPHFVASNCVIYDRGQYKIWYLSCTGWFRDETGKVIHKYHIKYAESSDGIEWNREGVVAIDYLNEYEYAISVPRVLKDQDGLYRMWFSSRATKEIPTYRIRYAESKDGITWTRKDEEVGMDVSEDGWDSEMICYPFVFDHKGQRYMLYNGNGYGKTGFGLAVLE
ncbi:MAG: hypothetical protein HOO85_01955 [Methylotenera sp.]|nr:hypothetical protein [Methylotenera sp.]